ncbi:LPXTG cell wall anchor domain-containing protein, partial [Streptococcus pseudopneumoniae]|uniref:LPXTG cell wall anchor domain-containing protein n=1 Tax=Streptococcus pseudopneumoniae TaxID=257758 RepID=UPI0018B02A99
GDGLTDKEEVEKGTDPTKADTDGDGFTDKEEVDKGTNPKDPNSKPESKPVGASTKDSDSVKDPSVTSVKDPSNLTDAEKAKVAEEVKKSNPTAKDIKVNKDGSVVVTFEDGTTSVIPADKTVKKSDSSVAVNPATNQDSPAQAPAEKAGAKELPNTGTEQSSASLALALLAAATGGLLIAKKRKEEE